MNLETVVQYGIKVVGVLVVLFIGTKLAGFLASLTRKAMTRANIDQTLTQFTGNLVRWAVLVLVGLACLGAFGINTTSFAAVIGAAGLAIGLAFQGTLSSIAAGAMLLILRPFKVGDVINVGGTEGEVVEIGLFGTLLDTLDNRRIIVPNSAIFGNTIENYTVNGDRRVEIAVGTEYGADLDKVMEVMIEGMKSVEKTTRPPEVALIALGASSVDWSARTWCKQEDYFAVWSATVRAGKSALDAAEIGIPYQTVDVNITDAGDLKLSA